MPIIVGSFEEEPGKETGGTGNSRKGLKTFRPQHFLE